MTALGHIIPTGRAEDNGVSVSDGRRWLRGFEAVRVVLTACAYSCYYLVRTVVARRVLGSFVSRGVAGLVGRAGAWQAPGLVLVVPGSMPLSAPLGAANREKTEGSSSIWQSNGLQNRRLRVQVLPPLYRLERGLNTVRVGLWSREVRAFASRQGGLSGGVLVLNATFEPLNIVSVRRAVVLLLKEKAEVLEATQARIRSESLSLDMPLVIRLVYYVRVPHRLLMPLTRRTVLARDQYTCQYCGAQPIKGQLTVDHVLPRSRGGEHVWENVVTACIPCNQRKRDRTLREAGMRLLVRPSPPRYAAVVLLGRMQGHEVWRKYIH